MANYAGQDELSITFQALADPTRREILSRLSRGESTLKELAEPFDLSLQAVSKHVKVLENGGLIHRRKRGRTTYLTLNRQALQQLQDWVGQFHPYWGSDQATYENYDHYLGNTPPATTATPTKGDGQR